MSFDDEMRLRLVIVLTLAAALFLAFYAGLLVGAIYATAATIEWIEYAALAPTPHDRPSHAETDRGGTAGETGD